MRECVITGCELPTRYETGSAVYCVKHQARIDRYGDPDATGARDRRPAAERWKTSYEVDPKTNCWNWTGVINAAGYGRITDGADKQMMAHRFVYEQCGGTLIEGMELDHLCRNRKCVNPKHLDQVTHAINVRRGDGGLHNMVKTHCKQGHEYTPENTIILKRGWRNCRACQRKKLREHMQKRRDAEKAAREPQTHCKNGHELTPENTYYTARGGINCRQCCSDGSRKRHRVKRTP